MEIPDESEKQKELVDTSRLLDEQEFGASNRPIMVPVESQQVNGNATMNGADGDLHHSNGVNGYHSNHGNENQEHTGMGPGTIMVNLLTGVRKLPPSMTIVLVVMSFCWVSTDLELPILPFGSGFIPGFKR